ncbi:ammonia transport outward protein 2 [Diutina catenulata]
MTPDSEMSSVKSGEAQGTLPVSSIQRDGEYVIIGNQKFKSSDLASAFGGTLIPGYIASKRQYLNPAPLGLASFGLTLFCLAIYTVGGLGIKVPNVVVGLACFYGGAATFLAGVWEFFAGNSFGNLTLCSLGGFWWSYMAIFVPSFGIAAAYGDAPEQLPNALGFFLTGWTIIVLVLCLLTAKSTYPFFALFVCLLMTLILLTANAFTGKVGVGKAGGVFGIITSVLCWYNAWTGVSNPQNAYFTWFGLKMPHNSRTLWNPRAKPQTA